MPDFNAQFWCEFVASMLVAVGAWLVGARFLLKRDNVPETCQAPIWVPARLGWLRGLIRPFMPDTLLFQKRELPGKSEEEMGKLCLGVLRDSVRFAEEGIKSQLHATEVLERKAILLGTLCAVMLGFLLSDTLNFYKGGVLGAAALLFILAAIILCARAIDFSQWRGHVGFSPAVMNRFFDKPRPLDEKTVLYQALIKYEDRASTNQEIIERKYRNIHYGRMLWVAGTSSFLGMVAGEYGPTACACGWLFG